MIGPQMILPQQCQMARALLGWSQAKLSELAGVARPMVSRFENGETIDIASQLAIKRVLEAADIEFTNRADGTSGISLVPKQNRAHDPNNFA